MQEITFTIDGVEGEFVVDADELTSYTTMKQLAFMAKNPVGTFEAMERIYLGRDDEFVERVGGMDGIAKLNDAAINAVAEGVKAKNSSASSSATKSTATK